MGNFSIDSSFESSRESSIISNLAIGISLRTAQLDMFHCNLSITTRIGIY